MLAMVGARVPVQLTIASHTGKKNNSRDLDPVWERERERVNRDALTRLKTPGGVGGYQFKQEANGDRQLDIDNITLITEVSPGDGGVFTNISREIYLHDGPHFISLRYAGEKGSRLFLKLSYRGPDTPDLSWICIPGHVLTPKGVRFQTE